MSVRTGVMGHVLRIANALVDGRGRAPTIDAALQADAAWRSFRKSELPLRNAQVSLSHQFEFVYP